VLLRTDEGVEKGRIIGQARADAILDPFASNGDESRVRPIRRDGRKAPFKTVSLPSIQARNNTEPHDTRTAAS